MVSAGCTVPVGTCDLTIARAGPMGVSSGLLGIGLRFGLVGSSVPWFVTTEPPGAVTVTRNENVVAPGLMVAPLQLTVPLPNVHAGVQVPTPANVVPAGIASVTLAVKAAPGLLTVSVYVSVPPVAAASGVTLLTMSGFTSTWLVTVLL